MHTSKMIKVLKNLVSIGGGQRTRTKGAGRDFYPTLTHIRISVHLSVLSET